MRALRVRRATVGRVVRCMAAGCAGQKGGMEG